MIAALAKFIDWSVFQAAALSTPARMWNMGESKLTESIEFLNGPNFLPIGSKPAELKFISKIQFKFQSPRPCEFAENNVVYGRLYRCAGKWQERPAIVLLHGGGDIPGHRFVLNLCARRCHHAGFNAATLELPYHFQRRPRQYGRLGILDQYSAVISPDYLRVANTYAQAIAEIRSLVGWLLAEGCPNVALAGASLGAYLAGFTACCDARLGPVVMALPPASQGSLLSQVEHVGAHRALELILRRRAACEKLDKTPLNLKTTRPTISKENILLIQGRYDLLALPEYIDELWQSWGQPEIWRLPHGHISTALLLPALMGRILRWLPPRMNK